MWEYAVACGTLGALTALPALNYWIQNWIKKKLCTKFRLSLSSVYFLRKYRKCTVWSIATKRLVEKYHFCENKVVCKSFRVHMCNSRVPHLFSAKFLPSFAIFWCYDKTFWSKATCGGKGSLPNQSLRSRGRKLEAQRDAETIKKCHLVACSVCFPIQPRAPCPGVTLPPSPQHRLGPPT